MEGDAHPKKGELGSPLPKYGRRARISFRRTQHGKKRNNELNDADTRKLLPQTENQHAESWWLCGKIIWRGGGGCLPCGRLLPNPMTLKIQEAEPITRSQEDVWIKFNVVSWVRSYDRAWLWFNIPPHCHPALCDKCAPAVRCQQEGLPGEREGAVLAGFPLLRSSTQTKGNQRRKALRGFLLQVTWPPSRDNRAKSQAGTSRRAAQHHP